MTSAASTTAAKTTTVGSELVHSETEPLTRIGYGSELEHSASCVVIDQQVRHISRVEDGVEVMPIADALATYPWVQDLMFSLISPDLDEHIREVAETPHHPVGHFIWVHDNTEVELPLQSFTLMATPQQRQFVHNITVLGDNASLTMLSGSAVEHNVHTGHHISISESFLGKGARCQSVSIERWGADMTVHSYAATKVGEGAHSSDTTVALSGIAEHHSTSVTTIERHGVADEQSVVFAPAGTRRVMNSEIMLAGDGAAAESLARMVTDGGTIVNNTTLIGAGHGVRGYLGCDGLTLTDIGELSSTPGLIAHTSDAQLSHEASIGMISAERLNYLMATGLSEETARSLIVSGFLDLDAQLLPESLREDVQTMVAKARSGAM